MVLKLWCALELPGSFVKYGFLGLTAVISDSVHGAQGPRICVSNKSPDDDDATGHHFGKHCFRYVSEILVPVFQLDFLISP